MLAIQTEVSDGTLEIINVGIQYLERANISVFLSTAPATALVDGVDYQWTSDTTIELLTGPVANGVSVILRRHTDSEEMLNIYDGGGPFNRETLDENFNQVLFLAQEFTEGLGLGDLQENLNMNNHKILNVFPGSDPGDAVNFGQLSDLEARAIRVPEDVPELPAAALRMGRVLGFNALTGEPEAVLPSDATALAADLLNNTDPLKGAALVGLDLDPVAGSEAFNGGLRAYMNLDNTRRIREVATVFDWLDAAEQADCLLASPVGVYTAQLQAAVAAVDSGAATTLRFNRGANFRIADTLNISGRDNFRLEGSGRILQLTENKQILLIQDCESWEAESLNLYGVGTDYNPAAATSSGNGVHALDCTEFRVTRSLFKNFGYAGILARNCNLYWLNDNSFYGTHGITDSINAGEIFQFALDVQTNWDVGQGSVDWEFCNNRLRNMAIGVHTSPFCRRYKLLGNVLVDIRGEHGYYLNGQDITIGDNIMVNIPFVGIRLQSFWNAVGPTTDPIRNVTVGNNTVQNCKTGISIDKTHTTSLHSNNVTVHGNNIDGASNADGYGIYVEDCAGVEVVGNKTRGGVYGIIATSKTTGEACSGIIAGNTTTDTNFSGILGVSDAVLDISGNTVIRPCLNGGAGSPGDVAYKLSGIVAGKRIKFKDNTLLVDTSPGVNTGLELFQVDLDLGGNDLDTKPIVDAGTTVIRKRTLGADFVVNQVWAVGGLNVANGATATLNVPIANVHNSDIIAFVNHASDLQGCSIHADAVTGAVNVSITNTTGAAKVIADGFVRIGVAKFAV